MLAELLADGAVAGAAYKGLSTSTGDWTLGVIRRTWIPAAAVLAIFVLFGLPAINCSRERIRSATSSGDR
jgi:hypothetical protein